MAKSLLDELVEAKLKAKLEAAAEKIAQAQFDELVKGEIRKTLSDVEGQTSTEPTEVVATMLPKTPAQKVAAPEKPSKRRSDRKHPPGELIPVNRNGAVHYRGAPRPYKIMAPAKAWLAIGPSKLVPQPGTINRLVYDVCREALSEGPAERAVIRALIKERIAQRGLHVSNESPHLTALLKRKLLVVVGRP